MRRYDPSMLQALEILSRLNKLNMRHKVPYTTFHLSELSQHVDIAMDYILWTMDENPIVDLVIIAIFIVY